MSKSKSNESYYCFKGYDKCDEYSYINNNEGLIIAEYLYDERESDIAEPTECIISMEWDSNTNKPKLDIDAFGGYTSFKKLNDFYKLLSNYKCGVSRDELIEKLDELGYKDMTYSCEIEI